ncbi:acetyl-CoA carboxylase carboxyl transferase subunit beta, partial [Francisella tularensis subsp. holarctica]|nr:acetyl-CoA carboxylase carboxyl transferase subunit beta [Francisella tularensis subsp. holarctica]
QTVSEKLPEGFQRCEFLVEKGMVDMIVDLRNLIGEVAKLIDKLMPNLNKIKYSQHLEYKTEQQA